MIQGIHRFVWHELHWVLHVMSWIDWPPYALGLDNKVYDLNWTSEQPAYTIEDINSLYEVIKIYDYGNYPDINLQEFINLTLGK